jgi:hypothetical protein
MSTAAMPWEKYASPQAASGGPWEKYAAPPTEAPPDDRNAVQRTFDDLTTVTPEQEKGHSWLTNKAQEFGAGAIGSLSPLFHPVKTLESVPEAVAHPVDTAKNVWQNVKEHPAEAAGGLVGMADTAGLGEAAASPLLPSAARASRVFADIEKSAKDVPVTMERTQPALDEFRQSVRTGGKNAPVMNQLQNRITPRSPKVGILDRMQNDLNDTTPEPPAPNPINFPEARDFYSNISRQTARPGFLRRAIEPPGMGDFRFRAGNVREALNSDLTNAADAIGRGEDYTNAMKEYGRAKTLQKVGKGALLLGAGEAARRTGLLGKIVHQSTVGQ